MNMRWRLTLLLYALSGARDLEVSTYTCKARVESRILTLTLQNILEMQIDLKIPSSSPKKSVKPNDPNNPNTTAV